MSKEYIDERMNWKWLSKGMKDSILTDYPLAVNPRAGRARLSQIAKEAAPYTDLMAGDQRGYVAPPKYVLDAVTDAIINKTGYGFFTGGELAQELFNHLANRYQRWYNVDLDPGSNVAITVGAAFCIDATVRVLTNPGDDVIIMDPDYVTYEAQIASYNCNPVSVPLREEPKGTWNFDVERLEAAITPKTKLLMFSNANNPSSYMYTESDCKAIMDLAVQHDFWILNDQVSEEIVFDGVKYNSLLSVPGALDRVVTCTSYSKLYSLSGFRPGFAFARKEFLEQLNQVVGWTTDGVVNPGVHATLAYLRNEDETTAYTKEVIASLQNRRDYMKNRLREMEGVVPNHPQGLYWMFPWIDTELFGKTTQEIAELLLREERVYCRPGTWYGRHSEGHFRLSFCVDPAWIEEGMDKMERGLKKLL